jgi:four helix bundle protein
VAGARHFKQLIVWQLADQIRQRTYALTGRPRYRRDRRLWTQSDDAVESMCRNISEGFGGTHAEFKYFLIISRRSMNELLDSLRSAELKGYVTADEVAAIRALARRLYPAYKHFIAYLERTPDPQSRTGTNSPRAPRRNKDAPRTNASTPRTNEASHRTNENTPRTPDDAPPTSAP